MSADIYQHCEEEQGFKTKYYNGNMNEIRFATKAIPEVGRGHANILEPTRFSVKRIYRVQWQKKRFNPDELAKLYWDDGLTIAEIAAKLGAGRTTVRDHLHRLKLRRGR